MKKYNENYWDKTQSKAIQGICAVGIILHHMAQKTCAPWLPEEYLVHGLEPFLNLGFLFVAIFFFCSGYGLYKSIKANPDYLKGFIGRHFKPIILLWLFSNYCFLMVDQELNHYCWFIYAILYIYLAFYISCKTCKTEHNRIILLSIFILIYIVICELLVAGTWTYNTIGVFLAGFLFAKYDEKLVNCFRKNFWFWLILTFAILLITFFGAVKLATLTNLQTTMFSYEMLRLTCVLVQFISALSFPIFLFILSQKVRIKNKVCVFLGSMTLELYLIHVLFVEMFSFYFVNPKKDAICYIPNIFLYILAVLGLSILSAYALIWARKGAAWLYNKFRHTFMAMHRDFKKTVIIITSILVGIAAIVIIYDRCTMSSRQEFVQSYVEKNIQFIPVQDKEMAVYTVGHGEKTVLVLRGFNDPCSTLTQRTLADELAKDYTVIVPDFFGTGFSSNYDCERNVENICQELHALAQTLELSDYILLTEGFSSIYAQYYVNAYPGEVNTVLTMDAEFTKLLRASIKANNASFFDYVRNNKKHTRKNYALFRTLDFTSFRVFVWPWILPLFEKGLGQDNVDIAYDVFFKDCMNASLKNERLQDYQSYIKTEELKYPANVKVIDLVSEPRRKSFETMGIDINCLLETLCENKENHKTVYIVDSIYCIITKPETIHAQLSNP